MPFASKEFAGVAILQCTAQAGSSVAAGTNIQLPLLGANPVNPVNNVYASVVNRSSFPTIVVRGKKTPGVMFDVVPKSPWFTAANLNSMIGSTLAYTNTAILDTAEFGLGLYEPVAATYRQFDGLKCATMSLSMTAAGGPIGFSTSWAGIHGDSEGVALTWPSFGGLSPSPGSGYDISNVTFTSAAIDQVRSFRLDLVRGQGAQFFMDGTYFAATVSSGMFGGALTIEQSPTATVVASSQVAITIGPVTFSCLVNLDAPVRAFTSSIGTIVRSFTLIDTAAGGTPCQIS